MNTNGVELNNRTKGQAGSTERWLASNIFKQQHERTSWRHKRVAGIQYRFTLPQLLPLTPRDTGTSSSPSWLLFVADSEVKIPICDVMLNVLFPIITVLLFSKLSTICATLTTIWFVMFVEHRRWKTTTVLALSFADLYQERKNRFINFTFRIILLITLHCFFYSRRCTELILTKSVVKYCSTTTMEKARTWIPGLPDICRPRQS